MRRDLAIVVAILSTSLTCAIRPSTAQEAFGGNPQFLWVGAEEFRVLGGTGQLVWMPGSTEFVRSTVPLYGVAPLRLPAGAVIDGMQCSFYSDGDATVPWARITIGTYDLETNAQSSTFLDTALCPQAIGYHDPAVALDAVVRHHYNDTARWSYQIWVNLFDDNADGFRGCEVGWHREVKATDTETFADVSIEDPRHDAIEALYTAGISDGCGDGTNFCPDNPVTRGQLALLLARAFGLHWPD